MTGPEVVATDADFPVEWADPADAEKTWQWDDMHMPTCLTPLAGDYTLMIAEGDAYGSGRMGVPYEFRGKVVHGYTYYVSRFDVPDDELPATRDRATAIAREQVPLAAEYWQRAVVELRAIWAWVAAIPVDELPLADLADAWDGAWARGLRAWQIHFYAIVGPYEVLDMLADVYESVVTDAPKAEALLLTQGTIHELTDVEAGMGRLAALAASSPELKAAVTEGASPEVLSTLPGGAEFAAELEAFLDRHGHLGQSWDDLALPSWGEEPWRLVEELGRRLDHDPEPAHERAVRLTREADDLADAFRARVAGDPEKLAEFERILAIAREIGHLTETHNYWIDRMGQARLRALALLVGRRLVDAGVVSVPEDVFYLHRDEIAAVLRRPTDRTGLIAERRADFVKWSGIRPPAVIGRPKQDEPTNRFGGDSQQASDEPGVLRGTGASAGIVRGPARVVLGPDDFGRVGPGDVIVAPSSNPSWVPLFAIAGGLVTNTGGVLSHAAVVAREFALPAVVGVADATSLIRDGQTVELDGTTGHVRLA